MALQQLTDRGIAHCCVTGTTQIRGLNHETLHWVNLFRHSYGVAGLSFHCKDFKNQQNLAYFSLKRTKTVLDPAGSTSALYQLRYATDRHEAQYAQPPSQPCRAEYIFSDAYNIKQGIFVTLIHVPNLYVNINCIHYYKTFSLLL